MRGDGCERERDGLHGGTTRWQAVFCPEGLPNLSIYRSFFLSTSASPPNVLPGIRVAASSLGAGWGAGAIGFAVSEAHFSLTPCLALGTGLSWAGLPAASLCFNPPESQLFLLC